VNEYEALTLLRLIRAQNELYDLWQKMSVGPDKETAAQFDRMEKLIDRCLTELEQPGPMTTPSQAQLDAVPPPNRPDERI